MRRSARKAVHASGQIRWTKELEDRVELTTISSLDFAQFDLKLHDFSFGNPEIYEAGQQH